MLRLSAIVLSCSAIATLFAHGSYQEQSPEAEKKVILPVQDDEDSISRRDFMRTKLLFSQNVLEGLTTGDFDLVTEAVKEIQMVTEGNQWVAIDNDVYRELTKEFKASTVRLLEAAKSKNIDATAMRYYQMSTSCIDCHKHIRKAGYRL